MKMIILCVNGNRINENDVCLLKYFQFNLFRALPKCLMYVLQIYVYETVESNLFSEAFIIQMMLNRMLFNSIALISKLLKIFAHNFIFIYCLDFFSVVWSDCNLNISCWLERFFYWKNWSIEKSIFQFELAVLEKKCKNILLLNNEVQKPLNFQVN